MGKQLDLSVVKQKQCVAGILFCSLLAGCAAVPSADNKSLDKFSASIGSLKDSTDSTFDHITVASEKRFKASLLEELGEGDDYSLGKLAIETDFKTLSVTKVPYFLKLKKLRSEVSQLNASLVEYVTLLAKLAHSDTISETTFDSLAGSLNRNVLAAAPSIKSEKGREDTKLFSLAAMSITKNYLRTKQSNLLVNAVRENQPTIQRFSTHLQSAVVLIARAVNFEYLRETGVLKLQAAKVTTRAAAVDQLITRNNKHFEDLQTLKAIHSNYGRLPLLHAEVGDLILDGNRGLPMMMRMLEATSKLKADYDNTLQPGAPINTPALLPNTAPPIPAIAAPVVTSPTAPAS